jgi:hypothetical protein
MAAQNEVVGNDWKFLFFTWLHNDEYTWPAPTEEAQQEDDAYHDHLLMALDSGDDSAFHTICDHYDYTAIERDRVAQFKLHPAQVRYWRSSHLARRYSRPPSSASSERRQRRDSRVRWAQAVSAVDMVRGWSLSDRSRDTRTSLARTRQRVGTGRGMISRVFRFSTV